MAPLDLVVMGAASFAVPMLEAVLDAGHRVVAVYTQPPRPKGRGLRARPTPLHEAATAHGLPVATPRTLRDQAVVGHLGAFGADAFVVAAYGSILPRPVLALPRLGCLNVHPSLLPRWRGAAPVARAIEAGDAETGVVIMRMDEGLDTGPLLLTRRVPMPARATTPILEAELAAIGAELLIEALAGLAEGRLEARPQAATGILYAPKLAREDGRVDWALPAAVLERRVRAFQPWPGVFAMAGGQPVKILEAAVEGGSAAPGTLLDDRFLVACGEGALRVLRAQRPGRPAADGAAFLRGARLAPGVVLGGADR